MKPSKESFKQTFINYRQVYKNILKSFYPSLGSTGFQERNLTVNFSKAYETTNKSEDVCSWFELQFGEKKNNHFDCVIINSTRKEILIIESKRFTSSAKKDNINKDIERIESFVNGGLDERFDKYKGYNVLGVILADVWKENRPKKEIYNAYKNEEYFKDIHLSKPWYMYDVQDIKEVKDHDCKAEYSLLSFIWEIK